MASSLTATNGEHDDFVHHIAVKLSREMNAINPNDLLARRVIDIASSNSLAGFIIGARPLSSCVFWLELKPCNLSSGEHIQHVPRIVLE